MPIATTMTKLGGGGRVVIPADFRRQLGIEVGDQLIVRLEDNVICLITPDQAVKQAQNLVRKYVPKEDLLSEELIHDRKAEVLND